MRGGVTYQEALHMSSMERTIVADIVKDNLETTKKNGSAILLTVVNLKTLIDVLCTSETSLALVSFSLIWS